MLRTKRLLLASALLPALLPAQNCFDTNIGTDLLLGDDATAQGLALGFGMSFGGVVYTDICVSSNGYFWWGPTSVAGSDFTPTEAELLAGAPRVCPLWGDFNPAALGSGHIYFNAIPASGSVPPYALITWAGVYEFGGTNAVDMQVKLEPSGTITVTYGNTPSVSGTLTPTQIIGASPGNNAASNLITLAPRPLTTGSDTFADIFTAGAFGYVSTSMTWTPTATGPGYTITDTGCTVTNLPNVARWELIGASCPISAPGSAYEVFPNGTIDLNPPALTGLTFLPAGLDYLVFTNVASPWFAGFSNNLGAGDDTTHAVALPQPFPHQGASFTNIVVSSNGFLTLGTTNPGSGCCSGNSGTHLSGPPRIAGCWHDLNMNPVSSSGHGNLYADFDAATNQFVVTWDQAGEFGQASGTVLNTFQIALDYNTGAFEIRYQQVSNVTHTALAGYSGGNGAQDQPVDLSAANGFSTGPTFAGGTLTLAAAPGSLPRFGTTFQMDVTSMSPGHVITMLPIGFIEANPPIDLGSFGAPGCQGYVDFVALNPITLLAITSGQSMHTFNLPIPNSVSFAGLRLVAQAASDAAGVNALGLKFSNGGRITIGM